MKYRKKPVVISAVQFDGDWESIATLRAMGCEFEIEKDTGDLTIQTLEGKMRANLGDYIIKGVQCEFYPCKEKIFNMTYEKVEE